MRKGVLAVMAGPSRPPGWRTSNASIQWLPPARAGDVAGLLSNPPEKLCLIDGLFDSSPAPWHKELMLLMAAGTTVFGASSMGALRAAELDRLGMIGIGEIYTAYRDGRLTGDDEVALIHATERLNWAPLSVPLVEVRATLLLACRRSPIDVDTARRLRAAAAAIHFEDRDWPTLRAAFISKALCDAKTAEMLEKLHVPLKQQDALACLDAALLGRPPVKSPLPPPMTFFLSKMLRGPATQQGRV